MPSLNFSRAGAGATALAIALAFAAGRPISGQQPPAPEPASQSFTIFARGVPVGAEQIAVARTADGWTVSSTGRLGAPMDVVTRRMQVRYTADWKPIEMTIDATVRGQPQGLHTVISGTTATTRSTVGEQSTEKTDTIPADALLLPNPYFGPYEALAVRLKDAAPGSVIEAYQPPIVAFPIRVGESVIEQIQTTAALIRAHRTHITLEPPGIPPIEGDLFADDNGRLLRVSIPAQSSLEVVREDIASVAARRVTVSRPNDEPVKVPANGFSLMGTLSRPFDASPRPLPAVILVGGSGQTDRDESVYGIPIFGQLASALADAGFIVLRYDKRGVGQSGGRAESAGLADYADDLKGAVRFMADRKDVDSKRIALVGHSEGGSVAMMVASGEKRVAALVLMATMGFTGAEVNMAQVRHQLDRSGRTDAEKQSTVDLQTRIQQAVLTGKGWEGVPTPYRSQAETPYFQSLLAFDPSKVMPDIKQPMLIVQGMLDVQIAPANAERLEGLARARKNGGAIEVAKIPGVNHLLVTATTGETDEYSSLKEKRISPAVASAVSGWLQKTFAGPGR